VRRFQDWAGPAIWVVMFALAVWIVVKAGSGFSLNLSAVQLSGGAAVGTFLSAVALTVTYFSTLLLNFCDFSRFAPDRRTVVRGNFLGLPVNFLAFAVVTVAVTAGSVAVFGEALTDPVEIVARIGNVWVTLIGAITFIVATIGINVVANFVSASYDLSNVAPKYVDFRRGGLIAAVAAVVILPWQLYGSPVAINYFLGGLGALLGPLFGIIFADYFMLRRQQVTVAQLYTEDPNGPYWYRGGWNPKALAAFVPSALICLVAALVPSFAAIAPYSWFIGVILGGALYLAIARRGGSVPAPAPSTGRKTEDLPRDGR
jgi:nucleobase:cation symporter-1, NCS1 family